MIYILVIYNKLIITYGHCSNLNDTIQIINYFYIIYRYFLHNIIFFIYSYHIIVHLKICILNINIIFLNNILYIYCIIIILIIIKTI